MAAIATDTLTGEVAPEDATPALAALQATGATLTAVKDLARLEAEIAALHELIQRRREVEAGPPRHPDRDPSLPPLPWESPNGHSSS
jgi:hypothetical protein